MVDWQSEETQKLDYVIGLKLGHLAGGIYIWEWVTNLPFDYGLATRSKKFNWSTAAYLVCRLAALLTAILDIVVLNLTHEINCHAFYKCFFAIGYICAMASSVLIAFRTIAIWNQNRYISYLLTLALITYGALLLYVEVVGSDGEWTELEHTCRTSHGLTSRSIFTYAVLFDVGSLILAVVGVRVFWNQTIGELYLTLYHQGIIWIFVIVVSYSVPLVFLWLNLNDSMNVMFQVPVVVSLTIAATRMHRGLHKVGRANTVHIFEPTRSGRLRMQNLSLSVEQAAMNRNGQGPMTLEAIEMHPMKRSAESLSDPDQSNPESVPRAIYKISSHLKA